MDKRDTAIWLIVGVLVGLSVGVVRAAPGSQSVIIVGWPLPADADGDSVPDGIDAFPNDPVHHAIFFSETVSFTPGSVFDLPLQPSSAKDVNITRTDAGPLGSVQFSYECGSLRGVDIAAQQRLVFPYQTGVLAAGGTPWCNNAKLSRLSANQAMTLTIEVLA